MCGLTGFWRPDGIEADPARAQVTAMADRLHHRGPDDGGAWVDGAAGIALGHRRLAIVDLSAAGHQPMASADGRWLLAYNGEVYNHLDLRRELEAAGQAPPWRGHSDTETLLACIAAWGIERTLQASVGMFALALWDRSARTLTLARDRAGEKPLYYGWQGDTFLFGSELKALRAHPAFNAAIDRGALALLLRHNYIPAPYSIYQGIAKLPPGTWLQLRPGQRDAQPQAYWSLAQVAEAGMVHPFTGSDAQAVDALEQVLGAAVDAQRVADVPLGALLSGGIDSTLITALMQARSPRPVRTFTIGFEEQAYDEAVHARAVAAHLGTEHTELRLSADDALGLIPQLPAMYDEPFADSSQLPTHLVMKLARQHVTVALSGDAGDEFFGGYNRYFLGPKLWRKVGWMPAPMRTALFQLAPALPASLATRLGAAQAHDKLHKLARVFAGPRISDLDDLYCALVSEWPDAAGMVNVGHVGPNAVGHVGPTYGDPVGRGHAPDTRTPTNPVGRGHAPDGRGHAPDANPIGHVEPTYLDDRARWPRLADPVARMMALDGLTYLPDDILVKVDRASMAVSLETRAPFLDHRVMEFAWSLPMSMKLRDGRGKWILRQLLDRHVPRALVERPKMGFGIPLDDWLRGPLRQWAGDLLAEDRLRREGYLHPQAITRTWNAHQRGQGNFGYRLWSVLMFQAWLADT